MLSAAQTHAGVTPGQAFVYDWTETSGSDVGLTGTADFILGAASTTNPGYFDITSFSVTQKGGFCSLCTPLTEDLSGVLFDSMTDGVVGEITGSYNNTSGKTHTFQLTTTDLPAGTWTFDDHGPGGGTETSMGTYTTTAAVDEPGTLLLLVAAGVGLLISSARRRSTLTAS